MDDRLLVTHAASNKKPVYTPTYLVALEQEDLRDSSCRQIWERIDEGQYVPFWIREDNFLQRTIHSRPVVFIPRSLQPHVFSIAQPTQVAGRFGVWKMFFHLCQDFYWPSLSVNTCSVVNNRTSGALERHKIQKRVTKLKLFPSTELQTYVSIDIFGPVIKSDSGNTV